MKTYITIGSSPAEEDCAQVGESNYDLVARSECRTFIGQLRRVHGAEPEGACLKVKGNKHDFGEYFEVVCEFDDDNEAASAYAYKVEAECPAKWDADAAIALNKFDTRDVQ